LNSQNHELSILLCALRFFGRKLRRDALWFCRLATLLVVLFCLVESTAAKEGKVWTERLEGGQVLNSEHADNSGKGNIMLCQVQESVGKAGMERVRCGSEAFPFFLFSCGEGCKKGGNENREQCHCYDYDCFHFLLPIMAWSIFCSLVMMRVIFFKTQRSGSPARSVR